MCDAVVYTTIGLLLLIIYQSVILNTHNKWFLICGMIFCFSISLLELYAFLPVKIAAKIQIVSNPLYQSIGFILMCLVIYYVICIRGKLL